MATADTRQLPQLRLTGQAAVADGPLDMTGMYVMHHAFRRDLDAFVTAARQTPATDRRTWRALSRRWDRFGMVLHHHHHVEDEHVWPPLLRHVDTVGDTDGRATLEAMSAEHDLIDPLLDACSAGITMVAVHGREADRGSLETRLVAARASLSDHLAHEETAALPLCQRHLSHAEWDHSEQWARRAYTPRELAFLVPWAAQGLSDSQLESGFGSAGVTFRVVHALSRRRFARRECQAFGAAGGSGVRRP